MKRRKNRGTCRVMHRWSKWAYIKTDMAPGWAPEIEPDQQFRMCKRCGHQDFREVICA